MALSPRPDTTSPFTTRRFDRAASRETIERTAAALRGNGFDARVADSRHEARDLIMTLIPDGAEVHTGPSQTLQELGVTDAVERSGRYDAIRPKLWSMDRQTQGREIRKLGAAPDVFLSSAHAITEAGHVLIASATGSQLGPVASGAGRVILAVGAQKLVSDVETGLQRIDTHSQPLEDARSRAAYGRPSSVDKLLVLRHEARPGRVTVVLIDDAIGF